MVGILKFIFGAAPILIVLGVCGLFELSDYEFFALLLLSPISVFIIYRLKKA